MSLVSLILITTFKVYVYNKTFSDIPKKALLNKISILRKERQAANIKIISNEASDPYLSDEQDKSTASNSSKRQLILDTIESLKRSLEDQSIELYEINDPE